MSELQTTDLPFEELPPNNFVISVMGANGDTKHMWDTSNAVEVDAARKLFAEPKGKGYTAFKFVSYEKNGKKYVKKGDPMPEFESDAGRMRLQPPANAEEIPPVQGVQTDTFEANENHVMVPPMTGG